MSVTPLYALPSSTSIGEGSYTDWDDAYCEADREGADDTTNPERADITDFCIYTGADSLYVLMAFDDIKISGNVSTGGLRVDLNGDAIYDIIVLASIGGNPAALDNFSISLCDATGDCSNEALLCSSHPCTRSAGSTTYTSQVGGGNDRSDPFVRSSTRNCSGSNCNTLDTYVELAIPWQLLPDPDGAPGTYLSGAPTGRLFAHYGSFPSGPGNSQKDLQADQIGNQDVGISCTAPDACQQTTLDGAPVDPTAVTLVASHASATSAAAQWLLPVVLLLGMFTSFNVWRFRCAL